MVQSLVRNWVGKSFGERIYFLTRTFIKAFVGSMLLLVGRICAKKRAKVGKAIVCANVMELGVEIYKVGELVLTLGRQIVKV